MGRNFLFLFFSLVNKSGLGVSRRGTLIISELMKNKTPVLERGWGGGVPCHKGIAV